MSFLSPLHLGPLGDWLSMMKFPGSFYPSPAFPWKQGWVGAGTAIAKEKEAVLPGSWDQLPS